MIVLPELNKSPATFFTLIFALSADGSLRIFIQGSCLQIVNVNLGQSGFHSLNAGPKNVRSVCQTQQLVFLAYGLVYDYPHESLSVVIPSDLDHKS